VTSGQRSSVARCRYCGREFDNRRFQVVVRGSRGTYDSAECALLDADGEPVSLNATRAVSAGRRKSR
jgi:hypothetical protein